MKYLSIFILLLIFPGCSESREPFGGRRASVFFWSTDTDPAHYPIEILYQGKSLGIIRQQAPSEINCDMAYDSGYVKVATPVWLVRTYVPSGDYIFSARFAGSAANLSWPQSSINLDYQCFYITP